MLKPHTQTAPLNNVQGYRSPTKTYIDNSRTMLGAAFRLENDVVNLLDYMSRPEFERQPDFDYSARARDSPRFFNSPDSFRGIESDAEWDYMEQLLEEEAADRQKLMEGGMLGVLSSMAAGVLSPTILIPAGSAATAKSVGQGALRTAGWVTLGAAVQEGVLQANQELRTGAESAVSLTSAAVLGAALGGAVRYLDPLGMDGVVSRMADPLDMGTIQPDSPSASSLSAAAVPEDTTRFAFDTEAGRLEKGFGMEKMLKHLGPVTRIAQLPYKSMRWAAAQLSTGGVYREGNIAGTATAEGGDIESLIKLHYGNYAQAHRAVQTLFKAAYKNGDLPPEFQAKFGGDYKKFSVEIGHALEAGGEHPLKAVREAAAIYRDQVFMPFYRRAKESGMQGFAEITPEDAMRYLNRNVNRNLAAREFTDFRAILYENVLEKLTNNKRFMGKTKRLEGEDLPPDFDVEPVVSRAVQEQAEAMTDQLAKTLLGEQMRHGSINVLLERGPELARMLDIDVKRVWSNGRSYDEFLERDVEKLARSYVRTMAPDLELFNRFGTVNPAAREGKNLPWVTQMDKEIKEAREAAEKIADKGKREKALAKVHEDALAFSRDMKGMVDRLRHIRGLPDDFTNPFYRAGHAMQQLNVLRMMGKVVISSIPDLARPVFKYGLLNTFRDGFLPLVKNFPEFVRMTGDEARYAGVAIDMVWHLRSTAYFDLLDDVQFGTAAERGLTYAQGMFGRVALFDQWNTGMKQFSSALAMADFSRAIKATAEGRATRKQTRMLAGHNISEADAGLIWRQLGSETGGTEFNGVRMPNTQDWTDQHAVRVFRAAIARAVDDTIITPGLERSLWVDSSSFGRLVAQFKSFTLSSTFKTLLAGAQDVRAGHGARVLTGSVGSLALGAASYYVWARAKGGDAETEMLNSIEKGNWEKWADEAIARSGLIGVFEEARRAAERLPATSNAVTFANEKTTASPFGGPVGTFMGPTLEGLAGTADNILMTLGDPTEQTFNQVKRLAPFNQVFYLERLFEGVNQAAQRAAGVSK